MSRGEGDCRRERRRIRGRKSRGSGRGVSRAEGDCRRERRRIRGRESRGSGRGVSRAQRDCRGSGRGVSRAQRDCRGSGRGVSRAEGDCRGSGRGVSRGEGDCRRERRRIRGRKSRGSGRGVSRAEGDCRRERRRIRRRESRRPCGRIGRTEGYSRRISRSVCRRSGWGGCRESGLNHFINERQVCVPSVSKIRRMILPLQSIAGKRNDRHFMIHGHVAIAVIIAKRCARCPDGYAVEAVGSRCETGYIPVVKVSYANIVRVISLVSEIGYIFSFHHSVRNKAILAVINGTAVNEEIPGSCHEVQFYFP